MYALLVAKRYTPGDISSGLFSAIFVQVRVHHHHPSHRFSYAERCVVSLTSA
jgi:hypothetical protein